MGTLGRPGGAKYHDHYRTGQQQQHFVAGIDSPYRGNYRGCSGAIRQQLTLFQSEIKTDVERSKNAAVPLILGMAVSLLAGFFAFMVAAHFAVWLWPQLPLFAAYGILGLILLLVGGSLLIVGKSMFDAIGRVGEKSVEGLKENVEWK